MVHVSALSREEKFWTWPHLLQRENPARTQEMRGLFADPALAQCLHVLAGPLEVLAPLPLAHPRVNIGAVALSRILIKLMDTINTLEEEGVRAVAITPSRNNGRTKSSTLRNQGRVASVESVYKSLVRTPAV